MKPIAEYQAVSDTVFVWQDYDPAVKCDCSSTAILTPAGFVLIDPLPLAEEAFASMLGSHTVAAVVVTSGNHQRDSLSPAMRRDVAIHAPLAAGEEVQADIRLKEGDLVGDALAVIDLDGFGPGEIALTGMGVLVVGDAVINIGQEGLQFLPDKYCTSPQQARKSAQKLLAVEFETLCMAHGTPVVSRAKERLKALIESS